MPAMGRDYGFLFLCVGLTLANTRAMEERDPYSFSPCPYCARPAAEVEVDEDVATGVQTRRLT